MQTSKHADIHPINQFQRNNNINCSDEGKTKLKVKKEKNADNIIWSLRNLSIHEHQFIKNSLKYTETNITNIDNQLANKQPEPCKAN